MIKVNLDVLDADTTCSICYAEFLDPEDLEVHVNQMHSTVIQRSIKKCPFCIKFFTDLEAYAYHLRDDHLSTLRCCKYCNRVFNDFDSHRKHETKHYVHVTTSKYSCSNCQMLFTNTSELEQHEHKFHLDTGDGVVLNDCLSILSSIINIKAMSFLQSFGEDVVYICISCEHSTTNVLNYIDHLKEKDCRSLVCDLCSSVYGNRKGLNRHFFQHPECFHAMNSFLAQCPECQKMLDVKLLREHSKKCQVIKCKLCDIIFDSMYDLSEHQSKKHPSAVLLQPCKYCQKVFARSKALQKHITRVHAPVLHLYKYVCVYCKAIFKHPKLLFSHFYSTHKDLEPYTCKICNIKFRVRKRFTIHIKLDHKSIGFVQFDDKYHVFFSDRKSEPHLSPPAITASELQSKKIDNELETTTEKESGEDSAQTTEDKSDHKENYKNAPKKVHFNVEEKNNSKIRLINVNSDFMSATETEVDSEKEKPSKRVKNKTITRKKPKQPQVGTDSSDDETLYNIKMRQKKAHKNKLRQANWNHKKKKDLNDGRKRFICNICKKYCYTFQNYNNHVSLHYKRITKCIKCTEDFKSTEELNEHYAKKHSSSQLTETLRNLLEKRKNRVSANELSNSEKFQRTIKKVCVKDEKITATLKPIGNYALSVQKFIESFTPEAEMPKKDIIINSSVTIKTVKGFSMKDPKIKLTKCNLEHTDVESKGLAMPVKFKREDSDELPATIKIVLTTEDEVVEENNVAYEDDTIQSEDTFFDNTGTAIPEVAQEVMLEGTEENTKSLLIPHKVVIPKKSVGCKNLRIAHLQPEAPFYKIIKVDEVFNSAEATVNEPKKDIKLPDGTKLINVNPLAHLIGDTPLEKIFDNTKYKSNQQKPKDFEAAIAMALLKLKKPTNSAKKMRRKRNNKT